MDPNSPSAASAYDAVIRDRFFEVAGDLLVVCDIDGIILEANRAWEKSLAVAPDSLLGSPIWDHLHPGDRQAVRDHFESARSGERTIELSCRFLHADGHWVPVGWRIAYSAAVERVVGVGHDQSAALRRRSEMEEAVAMYDAVMANAAQPFVVVTGDGAITRVGGAAGRLFGATSVEVVGTALTAWVTLEGGETWHDFVREWLDDRRVPSGVAECAGEVVPRHRPEFPVWLSVARVPFVTGRPLFLVALGLQEGLDQLEEDASMRTISRMAMERTADEIHDGVLQTLAVLGVKLELLRRQLPESEDSTRSALDDLSEVVSAEERQLRLFVEETSRQVGEGRAWQPYQEGIGTFLARVARVWGVALESSVDIDGHLRPALERGILRLIQEGVVNAARHGKASRLHVAVRSHADGIVVTIEDNGRGFSFRGELDHETIFRDRVGPVSLKRRVQALGGRMSIHSSPSGATLVVRIPRDAGAGGETG